MLFNTVCPKCGKKYSLDEKSIGKKAKCVCGNVFLVTGDKNLTYKNNPDPWANAFKTHREEASAPENITSGVSASESTSGIAATSRPVNIPKERSMTGEILKCLAYGSLGFIIVAVFVYYKAGFFPALLVTGFTISGFCAVMYQIISVDNERVSRQGMTFTEYQKRWSTKGKSTLRFKIAAWIVCITFLLMIVQLIIRQFRPIQILPRLDFDNHWKTCLLIVVLNFPILLLLAQLMTGDWKKYLKLFVRLFLWMLVPFHQYTKGFWRTFGELSTKEELFEWLATHMIYLWVCYFEYLAIKEMFLN